MLGVSIKKLKNRGIHTILRVLTVGLILGFLTIIFISASTLDKSFLKSTEKYDYVLGSSSNSSQISLNSVYFVNTPESSIGSSYYDIVKDIKTLKSVVPLKQVDSYEGLQVIGTTREFFEGEVLKEGRLFSDKSKEIVIGSNVAKSKNLFLGSKIKITHRTLNEGIVGDKVAGPDDGKPYLHDEEFTVVGILDANNTVYDNLLYMDIEDSHLIHSGGGIENTSEDDNNILDSLDVTTLNSILIKTGGSTGLSDLQKALYNDKSVLLYKLDESTSYVDGIRSDISRLYPIFISIMFVLLSLILSLIYLIGVKALKNDIVGMLSIRVPKSDIITYVILDSVLVSGLGVLLSYPIVIITTDYINSLISSWSLVLNTEMSYLIPLLTLPAILIYTCVVSFIVVNDAYEGV